MNKIAIAADFNIWAEQGQVDRSPLNQNVVVFNKSILDGKVDDPNDWRLRRIIFDHINGDGCELNNDMAVDIEMFVDTGEIYLLKGCMPVTFNRENNDEIMQFRALTTRLPSKPHELTIDADDVNKLYANIRVGVKQGVPTFDVCTIPVRLHVISEFEKRV